MIPKKIHYCWFGGNPKSKLINKCMDSWKKFFPDYEIIEWNEENFDINCCQYVKEAYENKKWAFVSDYARHYVLNKYGGVYVDTDVEILKPIDELLASNFIGFEKESQVNSGLIMGCEKNSSFCKKILEEYNLDKFINEDGLNLRTVCERATDIFVSYGLKLDNTTQEVSDYIVYDTSYFNPYNFITGRIKITENTYTIHHYAGSWLSKKELRKKKMIRIISKIIGEKNFNKLIELKHSLQGNRKDEM